MKVLFVLSRDHGELFNAMYFSAGQVFAPVLLVPHDLYRSNHGTIQYPMHEYDGVEDILAVLEREKPDVVLLFSGYLMVINEIFDEPALNELLTTLESSRICVATSDPTGGIIPMFGEQAVEFRRGQRQLSRHLGWLAARFAACPHLYTAPPLPGAAHSVSFCNPLLAAATANENLVGKAENVAVGDALATSWLFVISNEDYKVQTDRNGASVINRLIADRLTDAVEAGRGAELIAPQSCLDDVLPMVGNSPEVTGHSRCHFDHYMTLLLESEYVFYWNSFSASLVARAMSRLPFFTFDRGHLADFLDSFYERAIEQFYHGAEPPLLSLEDKLDTAFLNTMGVEQVNSLDSAIAYLAECPDPAEAIRQIQRHYGRVA